MSCNFNSFNNLTNNQRIELKNRAPEWIILDFLSVWKTLTRKTPYLIISDYI